MDEEDFAKGRHGHTIRCTVSHRRGRDTEPIRTTVTRTLHNADLRARRHPTSNEARETRRRCDDDEAPTGARRDPAQSMTKHRKAGRREGIPASSRRVPSVSNTNAAYSELVRESGKTPVLPHREKSEGAADEGEAPDA